jgi:hypothetical protein
VSAALPPAQPKHGFVRRHAVKLSVSAILTASLIYMLATGQLDFVPKGGSYDRVRWWTVPAYVGTLATLNYYRAVRWRFLLRATVDVPKRKLLSVSWIGFLAIMLVPFRLGEFVRPFMLRDPGRMEKGKLVGHISMPMATGTIAGERVIDALYLSLVLAAALLVTAVRVPLSTVVEGLPVHVTVGQVRIYGFLMLGVFVVVFIVTAVFYFARAWAHRLTLAVFGVVSRPLGEKLAGIAERLADGLHLLGRGRDAWPFLGETTLYWGINALGMWLLAWGCGVTHADGTGIGFTEACALMGMLGITIMVPGPPGLLGFFQGGIYAGMTMYFPKDVVTGPGRAFAFILYATQLGWAVLSAVVALILDRSARQALEEAREGEAEAELEGDLAN